MSGWEEELEADVGPAVILDPSLIWGTAQSSH